MLAEDRYAAIYCTACRPKSGVVWIIVDDDAGTRSEVLRLADIHPDDVAAMRAADRVQPMKLRVLSRAVETLDLSAAPAVKPVAEAVAPPIARPVVAKPAQPAVSAFGDLFGAMP